MKSYSIKFLLKATEISLSTSDEINVNKFRFYIPCFSWSTIQTLKMHNDPDFVTQTFNTFTLTLIQEAWAYWNAVGRGGRSHKK